MNLEQYDTQSIDPQLAELYNTPQLAVLDYTIPETLCGDLAGGAGLRTDGVDTNGAAEKVMNFDRLGTKGTPWHLWEDKT